MAVEKTVKINVDTGEAVKDVDKLSDSVKDLSNNAEKVDGKSLNAMGKASGVARKGVKSLSAGFKVLGGAIKAAGIGLIITAFLSLKEALEGNAKSAKFFKTVFEGVSIVMNDLINFVANNFIPTFNKVKNFFDNLTFDNIKKAIQENLIERFNSAIEVLGFLGDAVKKFFSGDFSGALDSAKEAGNEFVDVFTGVDGTLGKVKDTISDVVEGVVEYGSKVADTASKNIELAKSAEVAAAQQSLLIEKYDRQAEKLRQIRDNDLLSLEERTQANNELLGTLEEQEKAMLKQADAVLASAQAQFNKNQNTENEVALIEAQANKLGVLAQIEGFRSEQEVNRTALIKERLDLENASDEATEQRALRAKQFEAEREEDELTRLERQREILEEQRILEEERLQAKINSYALDTQARLDAEIELKDRLQEIDQEITENKKETNEVRVQNEKEANEKLKEDIESLRNKRNEIAKDEELNGIQKAAMLFENLYAELKINDLSKASLKEKAEFAANILKASSAALGKETAAGKAAAIAATTIDTIQSGVSAYKGMVTAIPGPVGIAAGAVAAAGSLASGYASVKKILSVKTPNGGGGGGGAPSAPQAPQAPAFNLVGQSGVNQVQESIEEDSQPIQAYVVGSQVTSQQELDRNQQDSASIG